MNLEEHPIYNLARQILDNNGCKDATIVWLPQEDKSIENDPNKTGFGFGALKPVDGSDFDEFLNDKFDDKLNSQLVHTGLAELKPEGGAYRYDSGKNINHDSIRKVKTRWIEMCYNPDEPINEETLDDLDACIRGLPEDKKYNLIKALANMHINDGPF